MKTTSKKPAAPPSDDRTVMERIEAGVYKNTKPWPDRSKLKKSPVSAADFERKRAFDTARDEYRMEEGRLRESFKADLFAEFDVSTNPKREQAFNIAWDKGHASGYSEIVCEFGDIVELIK